ncbi:MAG: hypothetical protein ACRDS0_12620, partial [Pseudonocardiaceae bacterium]
VADGSKIATFYYENRVDVPLDKVAPVMRRAILAIEDNRFYERGLARSGWPDQNHIADGGGILHRHGRISTFTVALHAHKAPPHLCGPCGRSHTGVAVEATPGRPSPPMS